MKKHFYNTRPCTVEAHRWFKSGDYPEKGIISPFINHIPDEERGIKCNGCDYPALEHGWIMTLEGGHRVCPGDWIITGLKGEKYPCKDDIFRQKYVVEDLIPEPEFGIPEFSDEDKECYCGECCNKRVEEAILEEMEEEARGIDPNPCECGCGCGVDIASIIDHDPDDFKGEPDFAIPEVKEKPLYEPIREDWDELLLHSEITEVHWDYHKDGSIKKIKSFNVQNGPIEERVHIQGTLMVQDDAYSGNFAKPMKSELLCVTTDPLPPVPSEEELIKGLYSRCGCEDPSNFETDGYKVTCKKHHMSWPTLTDELVKKDEIIANLCQRLAEPGDIDPSKVPFKTHGEQRRLAAAYYNMKTAYNALKAQLKE